MSEEKEEEKLFSITEANSLLPELESMLLEIKQEQKMLKRMEPEVKKAAKNAELNGGTACGPRYVQAIERVVGGIERIQDLGVVVKDLESGLCDFPYMLDGRVVYLCWKLGEQEVEWWHEIQTGYRDRQPL